MYTSAQLDLYADDTTVTAFADVKNLATLSSSLNKSVSEIQLWASANKLPLNEDKTKVHTITGKRCVANINGTDIDVFVNGKQLSNVDCATLLGVEIDSKLSFDEHIEKVCKKLASRIAILRKIRACLYLLNSDFSFIIALFALLCLTLTLFGQIVIKSRFIGS